MTQWLQILQEADIEALANILHAKEPLTSQHALEAFRDALTLMSDHKDTSEDTLSDLVDDICYSNQPPGSVPDIVLLGPRELDLFQEADLSSKHHPADQTEYPPLCFCKRTSK